ncbi:hypothetical protein AMTR_s00194p00028230 [Amborella trichopoda]|uniref:DUF659 domain-containing protein n=1 Tax=Amborella trichopoda TaxID=13333 RepID=U5D922_AMBTC|nr:hypothetical protein AMTR_s00194p00028230 [Amborella trichopoda]
MFDVQEREDVDAAIARCYYAHGIPFNVVKPQFQGMLYAINNAAKGYVPPKYERLRTSLLDKERSRNDSPLNALRNEWPTYGVSIISNGWSNVKNQSLMNIMVVSGGKAMFVNGYDCSESEHTSQNIADILLKANDHNSSL